MAKYRLIEEYDPIEGTTSFWIQERAGFIWGWNKCSRNEEKIREIWDRVKQNGSMNNVTKVLDQF
jgi:hypothetical protein